MKGLTRPVLRYHGGKWRLSTWIISHFPPHRIYVEPFGGGASVLLKKERSYAEVYNDMDEELVNLFRILRDADLSRQLREAIYLTPFSRTEHSEAYQDADGAIERARRMLVKSYMGFGSSGTWRYTGFRSNVKREGSIPAHDWAGYPDAIVDIVERLRGVIIENRPAIQVMRNYDSANTLHYVDPPYVHSTRGDRNRYRFEMADQDHRELAECLHELRGGVVLSGYPCALYGELFADWRFVDRMANADDHTERVERLWISPAAQAMIKHEQLSLII